MQEIAVIGPGGAVETTLEGLEEAARRLSGGKYRMAPEVEEIARRLIAEHHKHLAAARIAYLMADK
ncbi:MAG: hypothetical protein H5T97_09590, partial [Firmicutes bacterium]|nr:hypothetical protein [Bacillota bacterium]